MKSLLAILLFFTALPNAWAQQQNKIGVKLNISGKSGLEGQVRSYIAREFRAIGDVEITEGWALLGINIVIMEPKNRVGQSLGYTMSLVVTDRTSVEYLALVGMASTKDVAKQKQISQFVPSEGILVDHILQTLDSTQLQQACRALAAQIDGTHLEKIRTQTEQWRELLQNQYK